MKTNSNSSAKRLTKSSLILKSTLLFIIIFISSTLKSQSFRIEENSVNPNCGGTYCIAANGSCISSIYTYSYPSNVNNLYPVNPSSPGSCLNYGVMPDSILFTSVSNCTTSSFWVKLNGVATVVNCTCGLFPANHNFSAVISPDPLNDCDYLIRIYY